MRAARLVIVGLLCRPGCCLLAGDTISLLQAGVSKGEGNEATLQDDPSRHHHHNHALGEEDNGGAAGRGRHGHRQNKLNGTEGVFDLADAALRHSADELIHGIGSFMKKLKTAVQEEAGQTTGNATATVMLGSKKASVSKPAAPTLASEASVSNPAAPTLALLQEHGHTHEDTRHRHQGRHHHEHRERKEHEHDHESEKVHHNHSEERKNAKGSPPLLVRLGLEPDEREEDPGAYKNRTRKERAWVRADKALREGSDHLFHNLNAFVKKMVTEVQTEVNATVKNTTQLLVKEAIVEPRLVALPQSSAMSHPFQFYAKAQAEEGADSTASQLEAARALVRELEARATASEHLKQALDARDEALLRSAIQEADAAKLSDADAKEASQVLAGLEGMATARKALRDAVDSRRIASLQYALANAVAKGMSEEELEPARRALAEEERTAKARVGLEEAIASKEADRLRSALTEGEQASLGVEELRSAREVLQQQESLLKLGEGEAAHHHHHHHATNQEEQEEEHHHHATKQEEQEEEDHEEEVEHHHHHEHGNSSGVEQDHEEEVEHHHHHEHGNSSGGGSGNASHHEHHHKIVDANAYKNRTRKEKAWVRADKALKNTSHTLFHNLNALVKQLVSEAQSEVGAVVADATTQLAAAGQNITA